MIKTSPRPCSESKTQNSVPNSPSASAKQRRIIARSSLVVYKDPPRIGGSALPALGTELTHQETQVVEGGVGLDTAGSSNASDDDSSPFLVAPLFKNSPPPSPQDDHERDESGWSPRTPTRRPKGPIATIDDVLAVQGRLTRSKRTEQDDLFELDLEDSPNILKMHAERNQGLGLLNKGRDGGQNSSEDQDVARLLRTPSKKKRGMTSSQQSPFWGTPDSWLDRWRDNINMTQTNSLTKPTLSDSDYEETEEEGEGDREAGPAYLSDLTTAGGSAGLGLVTPKRKRKNKVLQHLNLSDLSTIRRNSDLDETSDHGEQGTLSLQGTKRRSIEEDDNADQSDDEEKQERNDLETGSLQDDVLTSKKLLRLDSCKTLDRSSLTPIRQLSSSQDHTPPPKGVRKDLIDVKPPRPPSIAAGKMPMYRPHGVSHSPSQRRHPRPRSYFDTFL
ncbi:hypothetical protein EDD11_006959 [Mortierella claussenii]|nr:hypothetical protein EDD11_006959 [Mortierella claussenii]